MSDTLLLELQNIGKEYYGNRVLSNVSFSLRAGEILGLVGENGAGKSTLMNILFGMPVIAQTGGYEGTVLMDGSPVRFTSPHEALEAGIGMVHQEFSLIPGFTATENILLNREVLNPSLLEYVFSNRMATLDRGSMRGRAETAIRTLGVDISPDMTASEMPVGYKQFIEIAREIDRSKTRLLFLDEPTAVLTESEAEILLAALRALAEKGIAIVFISHRLHEVKDLCNRIVVLRDGAVIRDADARTATIREIASWMVGRHVETAGEEASGRRPVPQTEPILKVEHLWVDMPGETVRDVSFEVRKGEIFGIGGLAGHGKLGIPNGIMGLHPAGGRVCPEAGPPPGLRAHARYRRRREGAGAEHPEKLQRGARHHHHRRVVGAGGAALHLRPDRRRGRGAHCGCAAGIEAGRGVRPPDDGTKR